MTLQGPSTIGCHWDDFGPQGWTKHRNVLQTNLQREFHVALKPLKGVRYSCGVKNLLKLYQLDQLDGARAT